ncbi:AMP-binding protein [Streptomyces sp. MST-110588]|nr:AMP-binding protein [Streptomyces sp. MST-110588]UNO38513.1 AMP-binding protein [Streptomyces sp. MST-110588]
MTTRTTIDGTTDETTDETIDETTGGTAPAGTGTPTAAVPTDDNEAAALLAALERRGVELWADEGRLRYRAPRGAFTAPLRGRVAALKPYLLRVLRHRETSLSDTVRAVPDPAAAHEPFPLTDIQQAYWAGETSLFELGGIRAHILLEFDRPDLDPARFDSAWDRVVRRHPMLRATVLPDGTQRVLKDVPPLRTRVEDLRGMPAGAADAELERVRRTLADEGPTTDTWPLFGIRILRTERSHHVFLTVSLLICDAPSTALLLADLERCYRDPDLLLPPPPLTFRDYCGAMAALRGTDEYDRALDHWRRRAPELPPAPELPLAKSPAEVDRPRFVRRQHRIAARDWERVKHLAGARGVTPAITLLTCYARVIARWSKSPHFTLNVLQSQRRPLHPDVDALVGNCSSTLLVEVDASAGRDFAALAGDLQRRVWADLEHGIVSGIEVLAGRNAARGSRTRAAMPVTFASALHVAEDAEDTKDGEGGEGGAAPASGGGWRRRIVSSRMQTPQVWIDHQVFEDNGDLVLNWDVVEELFPDGVPGAMFEAYLAVLAALTEPAGWEDAALPPLPDGQSAARAAYNDTAVDLGERSRLPLHGLFAERVRRHPDAVAVICEDRELSYGEVDRLSDGVAGRLAAAGCGRGDLVGVVMEKGWEQVVAVLGVLKCAAAYVPVDASWPQARRDAVLSSAGARHVLTQSWLADPVETPGGPYVLPVDSLDGDGEDPDVREAVGVPADAAGPDDLAYVIYTSGSTGHPKGVAVDHRAAVNTVLDINRRYGLGPEDRVFGISALSFDLSVWDVFGALAAGAALVLPAEGARRDPASWSEEMARTKVSVWNSVPALLELLVEYAAGRRGLVPDSLRLVLLSGDWIPLTLPERLRRITPGATVVGLGAPPKAASGRSTTRSARWTRGGGRSRTAVRWPTSGCTCWTRPAGRARTG